MVERAAKIGNYKSYLLYKGIINRLRESPCSQLDLAEAVDTDVSNIWRVIRVLVTNRVIKRCRYEVDGPGKRAIYELVKDE